MCTKSTDMDYEEPEGGSNGQEDATDSDNPPELQLSKVDEAPVGVACAGEKNSSVWDLALDFMSKSKVCWHAMCEQTRPGSVSRKILAICSFYLRLKMNPEWNKTYNIAYNVGCDVYGKHMM